MTEILSLTDICLLIIKSLCYQLNICGNFLCKAYYNWAIAISDRAKMRGRTKEAEELWKQVGSFSFHAMVLNFS